MNVPGTSQRPGGVLVLRLDDVPGESGEGGESRVGDLAVSGGKGANLARMVEAGLPVPPGFVVTTSAYDTYVAEHGLAPRIAEELNRDRAPAEPSAGAAIRAMFEAAVPQEIAAQIDRAYRSLGEPLAAVRSSATAEDLPTASFAGQQDTYLGVRGTDEIVASVRRCWASLWTDRAIAYRSRAGVPHDSVSLAVVVQTLVASGTDGASGVLFTADPASGRRDVTVVNATFGLGEALVSGHVTPDEMRVCEGRVIERVTGTKEVATVLAGHDGTAVGDHAASGIRGGTVSVHLPVVKQQAHVLSDEEAIALAVLGSRVEALFGAPQDIEWVRADGEFVLVQARPITALPEPAGPTPTDWTVPRSDGMYIRASIVEQMPDPLSPLFADLVRPGVASSLRVVLGRYFDASIIRPGDMDFVTVNGFAYYFYSRAGMLRMCRAAPKGLVTVFKPGGLNGVTYWQQVGLPQYRETVARHAERDATLLTCGELVDAAAALVDAGALYYTSVQAVIPQAATSEIAFTKTYDTVLRRRGAPPAITLLLGSDSTPLDAEKSLFSVAAWCRGTPGVAEAVRAGLPVPAEHVAEFDRRLDAHLGEFGHLTYNLDLMSPVPADDPGPVLAALRYAVSPDAVDPAQRQARLRAERDDAEKALMARLDPVRRALARRELRWARRLGPLREDALAAVGLGWPHARRFLRELGSRFVSAGVLENPDDVYFLTAAEVRDLARVLDASGETAPALPRMTTAVDDRRAVWRGQGSATPPGWLPRGGFWYQLFRRYMPSNESEQTGDTLKGLGASGGRVTGTVRVVTGPGDIVSMRRGEILVAAITTPAYTPFFTMAAAVVTDVGGPLSHSSIVAREYGIPAVLGVGTATARIRTGDRITVDGDKGIVSIVSVVDVVDSDRQPSG